MTPLCRFFPSYDNKFLSRQGWLCNFLVSCASSAHITCKINPQRYGMVVWIVCILVWFGSPHPVSRNYEKKKNLWMELPVDKIFLFVFGIKLMWIGILNFNFEKFCRGHKIRKMVHIIRTHCTAWIWIWVAKDQAQLLIVILVHGQSSQ